MNQSKASVPGARAGRPRRFGAEDELKILFDAALVVMARNGFQDAAVAEILNEANLSTRSFYRHFESKDQLLSALYRREAESAAERLNAKVNAAGNPLEALDAWISEIVSFGHHRTKAERVAVLGSPGAMKAEGYAEETRHAGNASHRTSGSTTSGGPPRRHVPHGRTRRRPAHPISGVDGGRAQSHA